MIRTPDGRVWIDLTDHEIRMAYWFYVPNRFLKSLHSLPLSPAGIDAAWARGRDLDLYVRQAWRHRNRGSDALIDPYSYSSQVDRDVKRYREEAKLPPLPDHLGTWHPAETMPPSACRARLTVKQWRRRRIQSITGTDIADHGIWRGNVATQPGQYQQGYRREAFAGETRATAVEAFRDAWDARHGEGAWERNPEVLIFSFKIRSMDFTYQAGDVAA